MKRAGDNKVGVRTQCVVASTLRKTDPSTLTNVCLKINAKLGGTNSTISRCDIYKDTCTCVHVYICLFVGQLCKLGKKSEISFMTITTTEDMKHESNIFVTCVGIYFPVNIIYSSYLPSICSTTVSIPSKLRITRD